MTNMELTRRSFVVAAAAAGGGLMLGIASANALAINRQPWLSPTDKEGTEINEWLAIDPDGVVTIRAGQNELGQGSFTYGPMIVNEELHADWNMVRTQYIDAHRHVMEDNLYQRVSTGGSGGVRRSRVYLQQAGASARERLKAAAAQAWGVDVSTVAAKDSVLSSGNRTGTFAEFATAAASITFAEEPAIKTPDQYQLMGTSVARLDTPFKVNGSAHYGIDTRLPGMAYAAVYANPVPWGGSPTFDPDPIMDRAGVIAVVEMKALQENVDNALGNPERSQMMNSVAVVADTYYRAKTALELMPLTWDYGPNAETSNASLMAQAEVSFVTPGEEKTNEGDALGILGRASNVITADYQRPYEPHARMEPVNATISIADGRLDVYVGSQSSPRAMMNAADHAGIDYSMAFGHNHFVGTGFGGGRGVMCIKQAVEVCMAVDRPVKLLWTREEEMMQSKHRPWVAARMTASLGSDGLPEAWHSRAISVGRRTDSALSRMPYAVPNHLHDRHELVSHLPTSSHRAPGNNANGFIREQFVDELALAGGWDPLEWRLHMTQGLDDYQLVLNTLKSKAGFTTDLPRGEGMGIGLIESHGSIVAEVATVTVSRRGQLRIEKVVVVVDSGHIVTPQNATMQMEGCVIFEIAHALMGGLEVANGRYINTNYDKFHLTRIDQAPEIEVHFALSGGEKWGGIGEPGVPPFAPALANAIFFATGKRARTTPLINHDFSWS